MSILPAAMQGAMHTRDLTHPPKPRLTLRVGVTGKRAMSADLPDQDRTLLAGVIESLGNALVECGGASGFWSDEPPLLRIICGLAEGVDQIAAEVAVARAETGSGPAKAIETRLAAILPFPRDDFVQ